MALLLRSRTSELLDPLQPIDLGTGVLPLMTDRAFLAAWDSKGTLRWVETIGTFAEFSEADIDTAPDGVIWVRNGKRDEALLWRRYDAQGSKLNEGSAPLNALLSKLRVDGAGYALCLGERLEMGGRQLLKLSPEGDVIWQQTVDAYGSDLALDRAGNSYLFSAEDGILRSFAP